MNDSLRRSEELLKELKEIEEGKKGDSIDLISLLKTFIVQTTEQQRLVRKNQIEEEERKIKDAGESIERKKRLERLLVNLNDRLKRDPEKEVTALEGNKLIGEQEKEELTCAVEGKAKASKNEKNKYDELESEESTRSSQEESLGKNIKKERENNA